MRLLGSVAHVSSFTPSFIIFLYNFFCLKRQKTWRHSAASNHVLSENVNVTGIAFYMDQENPF